MRVRLLAISVVAAAVSTSGAPWAQEVPDFGFPVGFSAEKMDRTAGPRDDFPRYAAGRWRAAAQIPSDTVRISGMDLMSRRVDVQLRELLEDAARTSATAPRGSPRQQVGDLFAAGMDEKRLRELGVSPLAPELARLEALRDAKDVARAVARLGLVTDDPVFLGAGVMPDTRDRDRYAVAVTDGKLGLANPEDYAKPESARIREVYLTTMADTLVIAGTARDEAKALASQVLAVETRIARLRQSPVDRADPNKRFVRMSYAELKALTPSFDWDAYFEAVSVVPPREVLAVEVPALRERGALLAELRPEELRAYLRWELLRRTTPYLTPAFLPPYLALSQAIYGDALRLPPRTKQVAGQLAAKTGHPLSRLYVEKYFGAEARRSVEDLIRSVRAQFRGRLETNRWLAADTRARALEKLDRISVSVGYPDQWVDYSGVEVRPDDYLGSMLRISEFLARRNFARLGTPVREDSFNDPAATLPIVINAAYEPSRNAIEIPAAFLQPPVFDPKADAAVNFCAVGAVIGHELTHGFDSQGRLYDAVGNVRDWWTAADEANFNAQTAKLVRQANAYEVLPGLHANGALAVGENLADVGGVAFAYGALKAYLETHPGEKREIDGLTPEQRCFVSWAQVWAEKTSEGFLRQVTAIDPHPPGGYRMVAPSQHEPGFYRAFGIRPGDPMWLAPDDRVTIW
ncbi:MAG: M13 family metallopeptidase [Deltaproteobacteria bacterium]|nr:M13 family metallopeptidase [Deltaproteobacteria bacterium]